MFFASQAQKFDVARGREREDHRPRLANRSPYHGFAQERPLQTGPAVRYRELRNLLQPIVIAGLPVIAAGFVESVIDTDCIDTLERSYRFETPADPPLQFRIDRCRLDVDVCKELCQLAIERDSVDSEPSRCHVSFGGSGVSVDVSFEVFTSGDGCSRGGDPTFRRSDGLAPVPPVAPSSTQSLRRAHA